MTSSINAILEASELFDLDLGALSPLDLSLNGPNGRGERAANAEEDKIREDVDNILRSMGAGGVVNWSECSFTEWITWVKFLTAGLRAGVIGFIPVASLMSPSLVGDNVDDTMGGVFNWLQRNEVSGGFGSFPFDPTEPLYLPRSEARSPSLCLFIDDTDEEMDFGDGFERLVDEGGVLVDVEF